MGDNPWNPDDASPDVIQQVFLWLYNGTICIQWCLFSFICAFYFEFSDNDFRTVWFFEIGFKLLVYHVIIFLASGSHRTPPRPPWSYFVYGLRAIAIWGFISD